MTVTNGLIGGGPVADERPARYSNPCSAKKKGRGPAGNKEGAGELCRKPRVPGGERCRIHGGKSPQAMAKAQRRVAEAAALKAVATYGLAVDTNPVDALLDEVRWTAGHVAWLRERVQEVEQDALVWGRTKVDDMRATEFAGVNTTEAAVPNIWLDLYQRERKHLVDVCKAAIAANIDERRVRLAERQGELLVNVIQAILRDLALTPEQNARVPEIVPRHLRAIAGSVA